MSLADTRAVLGDSVRTITQSSGRIVRICGSVIEARLPTAAVGDLCYIEGPSTVRAQVIAFDAERVALATFDHPTGIKAGSGVRNTGRPPLLPPESAVPGRVIDSLGDVFFEPHQCARLSGSGAPIPLGADPPNPLHRKPITSVVATGVRAIDGICPLGVGQRVGLFAGPGLGKSTLLGMLARRTEVDIVVVALVGERGREVTEFLSEILGERGLERAVVVVSTGDEPALRRALAPQSATAIAEYHRARGKRVLLVVDSLTRAARALRELGLAAGEVPLRQGFTPSVYAELPRLLERAGAGEHGSITAIYTVLTTDEGSLDPLGEELKSLLDGHIVLSNRALGMGIRPAVDLTRSVSRLASRIVSPEDYALMEKALRLLRRLDRDRDVVLFGGAPDADLARALTIEPALIEFLRQGVDDYTPLPETRARLRAVLDAP